MYLYELAQEHQVNLFDATFFFSFPILLVATISFSLLKALMVDLEHRFYGQSFPLADMSTDSLRYLNADQV